MCSLDNSLKLQKLSYLFYSALARQYGGLNPAMSCSTRSSTSSYSLPCDYTKKEKRIVDATGTVLWIVVALQVFEGKENVVICLVLVSGSSQVKRLVHRLAVV
jgi:hypothetical protein